MKVTRSATARTTSAPAGGGRTETPDHRGQPVLVVENLHVTFLGDPAAHVVRGVDLVLPAGHVLTIVGESGSGKSVTARALLGLLPPGRAQVTGSIRLDGRELLSLPERQMRRYRGREIAIIFQDPLRSLNPTMQVGEQIAEALRLHTGAGRRAAMRQATDLLALVGVPLPALRARDYPHQLSGGMRQRVMIAMAISCRPKVLIADEPTTALDVTIQAQIMELLAGLRREFEMSMILITHDMALAESYADEVAVMYAGQIVEQAPASILSGHVRMPYTRALIDAVPRPDQPAHHPLTVLRGHPPDPRVLGAGCAFAARCERAQTRCRTEQPPVDHDDAGHRWACWFPL